MNLIFVCKIQALNERKYMQSFDLCFSKSRTTPPYTLFPIGTFFISFHWRYYPFDEVRTQRWKSHTKICVQHAPGCDRRPTSGRERYLCERRSRERDGSEKVGSTRAAERFWSGRSSKAGAPAITGFTRLESVRYDWERGCQPHGVCLTRFPRSNPRALWSNGSLDVVPTSPHFFTYYIMLV